MARAYHFPQLGLFYQYNSYYSSFSTDPMSHQVIPFTDQYFKNNKQSIYGFQLNIPIFNQFNTITLKTRARVQMENAGLAEENAKSTIYKDVQTAYLNLLAAKDSYFATQAQFDAAQVAKQMQQESYQLGVSDLVQLSQATQTYVLAAASRAQAQYTLLFQKVILNYYIGTLSPDNLN